jgi:hypothetical protein
LAISGPGQAGSFVALVNGQVQATFKQGSCTLRVVDGDVIEVDGYSHQTARIAVIRADRGVKLPVLGQEIYLSDSREVLARVVIGK